MGINYKKLKKQIFPLNEVKQGYIFIATDNQKDNFIDSTYVIGSKRTTIRILTHLINNKEFPEWKEEFSL